MAQEQNEIRHHIIQTREQLGNSLDTLGELVSRRVATATDWRTPLRQHLPVALGAGLAAGLLFGWMVGD